MSRGSTLDRAKRRNAGLPIGAKEKYRVALFTLLKIALEPKHAQEICIQTLGILGVKPKQKKVVENAEAS